MTESLATSKQPVDGTCEPRFEELRTLFQTSLDNGEDLGASVAVSIDGELAVDLWGGWTDESRSTHWTADTITNVWSTTKTMTALAALVLVDRGELDVSAPVATYWPEFAAEGKGDIEVRHLMSHTSGLSGWADPLEVEDLYDWEKATSMLAAQAPWWEPGTASGYHATTQGFLVGEVIRRITGQSPGTFFRTELAEPLDAAFYIGVPETADGNISNVIAPPPVELGAFGDPTSIAIRTFANPAPPLEAVGTTRWRRAEIPAANGHGNARSVAQIQSIVANGGTVRGRRFLSEQTCELIFQEQSNGVDLVLGLPVRWGIGYALSDPVAFSYLPQGRVCFWGGWGGSMVVNDLDRRVTFAYMMNKMEAGIIGGARSERLIRALYHALG